MQPNWIVLSLTSTLAYMAAMGLISFSVRRHARSAGSFTSGGTRYPAFLIGFPADVGIHRDCDERRYTQTAYRVGVSAAWNVLALAVGFVLYAIPSCAPRFKELGEKRSPGR